MMHPRLSKAIHLTLILTLLSLTFFAPEAHAATITVSSIDDSTIDADELCTLREAINNANAGSDTTGGDCVAGTIGLDTITFEIDGAGPHTISPSSQLPTITDAVTIDGTTEPDFAGSPVVILSGLSAGGSANGLELTAGSSIIKGLAINDFSLSGIFLNKAGSGNKIGGTVAGDGNSISSNGRYGIQVSGSSPTIEGNTITSNGLSGIHVDADYGATTSPATAGDDTVAEPTIGVGSGANTINSNCTSGTVGCAGIFMLDTAASNASTLHTDNTIGTNNGATDVEQRWYGVVEVIQSSTPISNSITVNSSNGGPAYTNIYADTCTGGLLNNTIVHSNNSDIGCDNVTTWTEFVEFVVGSTGVMTSYTTQNVSGVHYSFDANDSTDPTDSGDGFAGEGITTGSFSRYQVMEVELLVSPYTPNTDSDENDGYCTTAHCSLREAIIAANNTPGAEIINLSSETFYEISIAGAGEDAGATGDLDILDDLTINTLEIKFY